MHKTPGTLPMTAGKAQPDQLKWSWSRNSGDEPYQLDQMSDWPLPLGAWLPAVANMSNNEFQGKYVHFNVIPNFGKTDQCIVSKSLVHEIASHHIMTTPIKLVWWHHQMKGTLQCIHKNIHHLVGKSMYSRPILHMQPHTNIQTQVSHLTRNVPNLMLYLLLVIYHICIKINSIPLQQSKDSAQNDVVTQHLHQQMLNQSQLNDTLGSILNNQQSLQRETITMMNEMFKRHENEQFIHDLQMFNGKNIDCDEWIAQIEKISNLTGKPEYILTLAKSSGTSYKMISQTPSNTAWSKLKKKLQEFYSLVAHACSHRFVKKTMCQWSTARLHCLLDRDGVIKAWNMIWLSLIISSWLIFL